MPISDLEFRRWVAFDQLSPIGDERADLNAASIKQASLMEHVPLEKLTLHWDEETWRQRQVDKVRSIIGGVARMRDPNYKPK